MKSITQFEKAAKTDAMRRNVLVVLAMLSLFMYGQITAETWLSDWSARYIGGTSSVSVGGTGSRTVAPATIAPATPTPASDPGTSLLRTVLPPLLSLAVVLGGLLTIGRAGWVGIISTMVCGIVAFALVDALLAVP